MDPPARNSMWRFGFATPVDYNDNELYCGGYAGGCELLRRRRNFSLLLASIEDFVKVGVQEGVDAPKFYSLTNWPTVEEKK
jgi:hypothetical protein